MGWKLRSPRVRRGSQAPYDKSISWVSAGQMQSVLYQIHQRGGLGARRVLARCKDLHKWVQQQAKSAIPARRNKLTNNGYEQLQPFVSAPLATASHHLLFLCGWDGCHTNISNLPRTVRDFQLNLNVSDVNTIRWRLPVVRFLIKFPKPWAWVVGLRTDEEPDSWSSARPWPLFCPSPFF